MLKKLVIVCFTGMNILSFVFLSTHYPGSSLWNMLRRRSQMQKKNVQVNWSATPWKGILIQTNFRSGSSFFGELFNQRDDVYYSYEPLIGLQYHDESGAVDILNSTFSCKIADASHIRPTGDGSLSPTLKQCQRHNICFRNRMKNLCSKMFCKLPSSCSGCTSVISSDMSRMCKTKELTVAKVIRLGRLDSIKPLMSDKRLDIKVIHLVRDPRGIMASRMKLTTAQDMKSTCINILTNVNLGLFDTPEWLRGRYKLIRYEDLAIHPQDVARNVYEYVGLGMTQDMERWINVNTMGRVLLTTDPKAQQMWNFRRSRKRNLPVQAFEKAVLSNAYTTIRNSNTTWWSWVNSMHQPMIEKVQEDCKELMDLLGYGLLSSFDNITSNDILHSSPIDNNNMISKSITIDAG